LRARLATKSGVHKKRPLTVPITTEAGRLLPGVTTTKSKEHTENMLKETLAAQKRKSPEGDADYKDPSAKKGRGRPKKSTEDVQIKAPVKKTVPVVVAKAKAKELAKEVVGAQRKSQRNKPEQGSLNEEVLEQKSLAKANAKRDKENLVKNIRSAEEEQADEPTNESGKSGDTLGEENEGIIVEEVRVQRPLKAPLLGPEGQLSCYICKQDKDEEGRSLNLKNIFIVRSHLSKCLYANGKLFSSIPPGDSNTNSEGGPVDELGLKGNLYHCQVKDCWLAEKTGEAGKLCYKLYAIHMASQHGALEMVMLDEGPEARVLVDRLIDTEEKQRGGGIANGVKEEQQVEVDGGGEAGGVEINLKAQLVTGSAKPSASTMELELDSDMLEALGDLITDLGPASA